jgi:hypothetical protein
LPDLALRGQGRRLTPAPTPGLRAAPPAPSSAGHDSTVPEEDRQPLLDSGVAAVYAPTDFELVRIMGEIVHLATAHRHHQG